MQHSCFIIVQRVISNRILKNDLKRYSTSIENSNIDKQKIISKELTTVP